MLTEDRHARRLSVVDFDQPAQAVARMKVPRTFNGRNPQSRRDLANALAARVRTLDPDAPLPAWPARQRCGRGPGRDDRPAPSGGSGAHPCHSCPDRESHARWAERHHRLSREADGLRRRIETRTNTIARQFDRVCDVLTSLDYLEDDEATAAGRTLRRIYTEMDLVAAECLRAGLWQGLGPCRARGRPVGAGLRGPPLRRRHRSAPAPRTRPATSSRTWSRCGPDLDRRRARPPPRLPARARPGFRLGRVVLGLGCRARRNVLRETDLAAGDFVRWMKQLSDLAGQVADAAAADPRPASAELRETARLTHRRALRRGVVAYSSLTE